MRSDSHYDLYEPETERKNWFKGCLFMALFFGAAMALVYLLIYFFGNQ